MSFLAYLSSVCVRHNMISRYLTIFFFSLITEAITSLAEGADTGEVEEVLYKDANTVQKFMRTEEFKVSGVLCC